MRLDLYHNPSSDVVLSAIGLKAENIPRFRGAGVDGDKICVHTRTGGGNRDWYDAPNDENKEGPWNSDLRKNPYFLYDEDDEFDSTYANFWFRIPKEHQKIKETENKEAKAVYGDAPTAIGIIFGDKKCIEQAQKNLNKLKKKPDRKD